jgi:hypothetical protein
MIEALDREELQQVQQAVEERLRQQGRTATHESFHQALLAAGLVRRIKTPPPRGAKDRPLVPIRGKPLSQTVTEERR